MNTADDRAPSPPCDSPAPCPHRDRCARDRLVCVDFRRYLNASAAAVHNLRYHKPARRQPVPVCWLTDKGPRGVEILGDERASNAMVAQLL
jgi:hypothetical protein